MEVLLRLARRLKKVRRTSPTMDDYKAVAKEYGRPNGSLRSWVSRYPEEWDKALEAVGMSRPVATAATADRSMEQEDAGEGGAVQLEARAESLVGSRSNEVPPAYEVTVERDPRVTQAQLRAICMDLDGWSRQAIANELGLSRNAVSEWFNHNPAVRAVRAELEEEIHGMIVRGHLAVAAKGAHLRVRLLERIGTTLDEKTNLDPKELGHLSRATTLLVESAEDRAGFPKTSISKHLVGAIDEHGDLDEMSPEELEAEERRLSAIEAEFSAASDA